MKIIIIIYCYYYFTITIFLLVSFKECLNFAFNTKHSNQIWWRTKIYLTTEPSKCHGFPYFFCRHVDICVEFYVELFADFFVDFLATFSGGDFFVDFFVDFLVNV